MQSKKIEKETGRCISYRDKNMKKKKSMDRRNFIKSSVTGAAGYLLISSLDAKTKQTLQKAGKCKYALPADENTRRSVTRGK